MTKIPCFRDLNLVPLAGVFDARTQDGLVNFQDYRFVLNMAVTDQRRRCRMGGWLAYGRQSPFGFKNQDLHDQMLGCQFYYPSYTENVVYGGDQMGYEYPHWWPAEDAYTIHETLGTYCGYAPDHYLPSSSEATSLPTWPIPTSLDCATFGGTWYNPSETEGLEIGIGGPADEDPSGLLLPGVLEQWAEDMWTQFAQFSSELQISSAQIVWRRNEAASTLRWNANGVYTENNYLHAIGYYWQLSIEYCTGEGGVSRYPTEPTPGVPFICQSFLGYPYTVQSSASDLSYADSDSTFGPPGSNPNWAGKQIERGLAYLDDIEAANGPSQAIEDARHFLNNIYAPAIDEWTDPRGEFSGSYGLINYTYYLEYHLSFPGEPDFQEWMSGFTFTGPGIPVYSACNTGFPDYYTDSYFTLCYDTEHPDQDGYGYGDPMPQIGPITSYSLTYCGPDLFYRDACREPITLLFDAVSISSTRQLIAATRSKIAVLNERGGNWRLLADGLGGPFQAEDNCTCSAVRFKAAQLGNYVIFVNGIDNVLAWRLGDGPSGCELWSAHPIGELADLGISTARVVGVWSGFVFIADVIQDAEKHPYRIFWSDFNAPLSWAPDTESLAGFQDLGAGERVVAMASIGGQFRVYTKKGDEKAIYEVALIGGDEVFNFREIYRGPDGIEYENSLVNTGKAHFFLASSGLFVIGEYERVPRRLEWMHKSTSVIYKGVEAETLKNFAGLSPFGPINEEACEQAVGGFDSERKAIWYSWPTDDTELGGEKHVCPNMTLVFFPEFQAATLVDHGFTAYVVHRPDYRSALRDFLAEFAGCDPAQFLEPKEGEPYSLEYSPPSPAYIRNETEDKNLPVHPDSLCARLDGATLESLCRACDADSEFLMASADDFTIKMFRPDAYYRERYVSEDDDVAYCPQTSQGVYEQDGYYSMMQGDAADYGQRQEKLQNYAAVDFDAVEQAVPNLLHFQVAYGSQPSCMRWADTTPRELRCLTESDIAEHEANNTRAAAGATFPMYRAGTFLAWRFYVNGTGGGACFNKLTLRVRTKSGIWI